MELSLANFQKELSLLWEDFDKSKSLIAVSGGVDSMVLLWLFFHSCRQQTADSGKHFQVAHINYKLRGEDSDLDQKLVEDFCRKHDVKLHIYKVSERDNCPKQGSIQLWARDLRYRFFREVMEREGIEKLFTAHHLDDQLETFILYLSRGTGVRGLCGIPANEPPIVRPLLSFTKEQIYNFAHENNIPYREDKSNKKEDYQRNKIRNRINPVLKEINADFLDNFRKTIGFLGETKNFVEEKIEEIFRNISFEKKDKIGIEKEKLSNQSDFVQFEILRKFGFTNNTEIKKMLVAQLGSVFSSDIYKILVDRYFLIISSIDSYDENVSVEKIFHEEDILEQENRELSLNISILEENSSSILVDLEKIKFPLKLRKPKSEDVFFPTGMQGKKKLSKYFKDEKYSVFQKEETCVLVDATEQILWVIPSRQDRRFSTDENTQKVLKIIG